MDNVHNLSKIVENHRLYIEKPVDKQKIIKDLQMWINWDMKSLCGKEKALRSSFCGVLFIVFILVGFPILHTSLEVFLHFLLIQIELRRLFQSLKKYLGHIIEFDK